MAATPILHSRTRRPPPASSATSRTGARTRTATRARTRAADKKPRAAAGGARPRGRGAQEIAMAPPPLRVRVIIRERQGRKNRPRRQTARAPRTGHTRAGGAASADRRPQTPQLGQPPDYRADSSPRRPLVDVVPVITKRVMVAPPITITPPCGAGGQSRQQRSRSSTGLSADRARAVAAVDPTAGRAGNGSPNACPAESALTGCMTRPPTPEALAPVTPSALTVAAAAATVMPDGPRNGPGQAPIPGNGANCMVPELEPLDNAMPAQGGCRASLPAPPIRLAPPHRAPLPG